MAVGMRWGVVATVREPLALLLAFVAHHRALGADEVRLYLDDPSDPGAERLAAIPGVSLVRCDAGWWRACGTRPDKQSARQQHNATHAYGDMAVDWLLHVDADEFLHLDRPLAEVLGALPRGAEWLRLQMRERVWREGAAAPTIFDGVFRHHLRGLDAEAAAIYGADVRFLKSGMASSPAGKALVRTGRGMRLSAHAPRRGGAVPPHGVAEGAAVLHFDGLTPMHWLAKMRRYAGHDPEVLAGLVHRERLRQLQALAKAGPEGAAALHARLYRLPQARAEALRALGRLSDHRPDIAGAVARVVPGPAPDLTPAGFDAAAR